MKKYFFIYFGIFSIYLISNTLNAQVEKSTELFQQLKAADSLLFNIGFNTCNMAPFETLVSENFEFYHDKGGITTSKSEFIQAFKDGLCKTPETYQSRRELVKESLEVFPLKNNGKLYGAIQNGRHQFHEKSVGSPETKGNIARFTHLWLLENGAWRLIRSLSYDHL
ncbi:MAG: hypothetical protein ACI83B_002440 [Sediminicola sp.]|jgi:hypothetical protein|tara:strand:- start:4455 stop:4955 length:501 start_codon:yes stop_codon:yes gene_type:complete